MMLLNYIDGLIVAFDSKDLLIESLGIEFITNGLRVDNFTRISCTI